MKLFYFFICIVFFSCTFSGVRNTSVINTKVNFDNNPEILDWYIDGKDTVIYTVQDSIKDEIERWKYKDSLYNQ